MGYIIVSCESNFSYVWDIYTGHLERYVPTPILIDSILPPSLPILSSTVIPIGTATPIDIPTTPRTPQDIIEVPEIVNEVHYQAYNPIILEELSDSKIFEIRRDHEQRMNRVNVIVLNIKAFAKQLKKIYYTLSEKDKTINSYFGILSEILMWNMDNSLCNIYTSEFGLNKPIIDFSFGVTGAKNVVSYFFPSEITQRNWFKYY